MPSIKEQLDSFNRFVAERVGASAEPSTLDQLYDLWRLENPADELDAENVAAIQASIDDFKRGEPQST